MLALYTVLNMDSSNDVCIVNSPIAVKLHNFFISPSRYRGFRPEIPYAESTSLKYQRRFSCVPGLYVFIFTNGDIFVGTADDLGETLTRQPEQWVSEISGVRLMARSKKGLDLAQEAMALHREVQSQGFTIHPLSLIHI